MSDSPTLGNGNFLYKVIENWEQIPNGYSWKETAGVITDDHDNVYVFSRGNHPMMVFDKNGAFIKSWILAKDFCESVKTILKLLKI